MSGKSSIEWTDMTWNPVVGCTKISPGCKNCYAKTSHDRRHKGKLAGANLPQQYAQPFEVIQQMPDRLTDPLGWRKPRRVFVNSVSDLFHERIERDFLDSVFGVMCLAKTHTFQVLTKRSDGMREYFENNDWNDVIVRLLQRYDAMPMKQPAGWLHGFQGLHRVCEAESMRGKEWVGRLPQDWPLPNVWLGVSVENQKCKSRIRDLRATPAAVRFLSLEPLLEDLGELNLDGIGWVIVGGESGPGARPCDVDWIHSIIEQCMIAGVPCFVKQLGANFVDAEHGIGGVQTKPPAEYGPLRRRLKDSHGGNPDEWPEDLRVREYPDAPKAPA